MSGPGFDDDRGAVWGFEAGRLPEASLDAATFAVEGSHYGDELGGNIALGDLEGDGR